MRRKGEQPLARPLMEIRPDSPVVISIAEGMNWFDAWPGEACTPYYQLTRLTGIPSDRFSAITHGGRVSRAEIDALARAWRVSSSDLIGTLPDPGIVVE